MCPWGCSFNRNVVLSQFEGIRFEVTSKGYLAEGVGFEPTKAVKPCRFSRPVHSTALPALREAGL